MECILHCDLNNFFASVECLKNPSLKKVPMVVCGDPNKRHGVVVAKNDLAKKLGIYTPETVYSALKKCPDLVLVDSHYEDYLKYSSLVKNVYLKYTDRVEPFSIDEAFLDVSESVSIFGTPYEIAYKIKEEVKSTLGLTISVGVSFNKILAKMASDMKKPDAITILTKQNFKEKLHPLPVSDLIYCGKATCDKLNKMRIKTIGDLANYNVLVLSKKFGKQGVMLHNYANGICYSRVKLYTDEHIPKSISQGITFPEDISDEDEILTVITKIADNIAYKLRKNKMKCSSVGINIKYSDFMVVSRQRKVNNTDLFQKISKIAKELFLNNFENQKKIRAITISVAKLNSQYDDVQLNLFDLEQQRVQKDNNEKLEKVTQKLDVLKEKYGSASVNFGSVIK